MTDLAQRLRLLQRQSGQSDRSPETTSSSDIARRLRTLVGSREQRLRKTLPPPGGEAIGAGVYLLERRWPMPASTVAWMPWGDLGHVERSRLVCFDTETTGLAGGVGTKAFMIGIAQWKDDQLRVRQLYLTALAGEALMLQTFASWLPDDAVFISYNGRSYDAPLLKGRYRLNRLPCPFAERGHVDLLHPVRRAYRGHWANCRLATVERELLRIVRDDDLPGSEAPAAWLAYLRGHSAVNLGRVLEHNHQDVVTLARLLEVFNRPPEQLWSCGVPR